MHTFKNQRYKLKEKLFIFVCYLISTRNFEINWINTQKPPIQFVYCRFCLLEDQIRDSTPALHVLEKWSPPGPRKRDTGIHLAAPPRTNRIAPTAPSGQDEDKVSARTGHLQLTSSASAALALCSDLLIWKQELLWLLTCTLYTHPPTTLNFLSCF